MNEWGARNPTGHSTEIECQCGIKFKVHYSKQDGHNEREEFNCPKCGIEHHVRASMPIRSNDIRVLDE